MSTTHPEQLAVSGTDFVTRLFEVIDGRRWDELPTLFAEDCTYHRPGYEAISGLDAVLRFYREERIISDGRHEIEHVAESDSSVACWGRFRGVGKDGRQLDERFSDLYFLDGRKIRTRRTYFYRPAI
ncbi:MULTISPECIES: nuclear transport factor 2 family protein [Kitasatospora]|uniref:SnoaL-like domain-containing protein n=1 Tax=Kitasatospora arboriphila TaxID=258052 RepID=A0ABN1U4I0_9ACTN